MSGEPITIGFDPASGADQAAIAVYRAADVQWPGPFSADSLQVVCIEARSWPIEQLGTIRFGVPLRSVRTLAEAARSSVQCEIPSLSMAAAPDHHLGALPNPELPSDFLSLVGCISSVAEAGERCTLPGGRGEAAE